MGRPITTVKRPFHPLKTVEGAAALLIIANKLKDYVDTQRGDNATIKRSELVGLEFVARLTAHTVDDLVYLIEKQQMEIDTLRQIIKTIQGP